MATTSGWRCTARPTASRLVWTTNSRKHVLSEKPFASTAAEAAEVRDAARKAGRTVVEGFHYLFHPVIQRLFALLDAGDLGQLHRVDALIAMPAQSPSIQPGMGDMALKGRAMGSIGKCVTRVPLGQAQG